MALDEISKSLIESLRERFGEKIRDVKYDPKKILKITVDRDSLIDIAMYLKNDWLLDHVKAVTGIDLRKLPENERSDEIEIIYHVGSIQEESLRGLTLSLATRVKISDPSLQSLTCVWKSAEFHEREVYEMLGVYFDKHPDLRRLLLPEFWRDIPPLRKDYEPPGR